MVKTHDEGGFRVYVYSPPREHRPPHVHVESARGGEVLIRLGEGDAAPNLWQNHHMSLADARQALQIVTANRDRSVQNGESSMAKALAHQDNADFERQYEAATREAREADRIEPRATAVSYDAAKGLVLVELRSGFVFGFPPERIPGLESTTAKQLARLRISPSGDGLHWDDLDVQVSLTGLVRDALNLEVWAPRLMGQFRSEAKARAARLNGRKGGRPRTASKSPRKSKERA